MVPASCKKKGHIHQNWIRDLLLAAFPVLEPDDVKSTSSGAQGEDVQLSPAARKLFPFQIEAKSLASIAVYKFYKQAQSHGPHEPIVFIKANRQKPLVILDAEKFVQIMKEYHGKSLGNS